MNRLRAARQPVSLCTPLTLHMGPMLEMVGIFSGLASMPRLDTMYPSSFPFGTPKTHFSEPDVESSEVRERCGQVCDQVVGLSCFDHYVINIYGEIWSWPLGLIRLIERVDLVDEALLHAPLVGGASVLQVERHGYVAVRTIRGDKQGCELIRIFHRDLVIA